MNHDDHLESDELLRALGRQAQDEDRSKGLDQPWEHLAAGTLSSEEASCLRDAAEQSDEGRIAYEVFRPLDAEFRDRVENQIGERLSGRRSGWRGLRYTLALAASVTLLVALVQWFFLSDQLPSYALSLEGMVSEMRSDLVATEEISEGIAVLRHGNLFHLLLTPARDLEQPIGVTAFLVDRDGVRALDAPIQISRAGAVLIKGTVGKDVDLPTGEVTLLLAVGWPRTLPSAEEIRQRLGDRLKVVTSDWIAWRRQLRREAAP